MSMGQAQIPFHSSFVPFAAAAIEQSIPERFHQQVDSHPDHPAIVTPSRQLSYLELDRQANQVAAALLQHSAVANEPVGLLLAHDAAMIIAILGVLKAGKVYVILDPRLPPARLKQNLEETGASLVVCEDSYQEQARHLVPARVCPIRMEDIGRFTAERPAVRVGPNHLCYILFTTGSTGQPKGVYQNHRNVLHHVRTYTNAIGIAARDRLLLLNSFSFVRSISDLFGAILNGATTCLFDLRGHGVGRLPGWIAAQRITVYNSVPTVFRQMASYQRPGQLFPDLRLIRLGGEQVRVTDVELYRKHFTPGCTLLVTLGTTETTTVCHHFLDERTEVVGPVVPIGHAVDGVEVLLLDDAGRPVPPGQVGQISVRSRHLALGYWGRPELTRAVFISVPGAEGFQTYMTGDLGQLLPDGKLLHLGRRDWQVKIRGHRIELTAVETALLRHPAIQEVAVVAREDRLGEQRLVAYLVTRNGRRPSPRELRRQLAQTLPEPMIPSFFIFLPELPLTPNGKVDHRALPAWQTAGRDSARAYVAPETTLEKLLMDLWEELFDVRPLGVTDDFFELGGTSLQAAALFVRIQQKLGKALPLATLLENPTIRRLALAVRRQDSSRSRAALVTIQGGGSQPPLFCVHCGTGSVFHFYELARYLGPDQPVCGLQPPGMGGGHGFDRGVPTMAARYVQEVLRVQPHGPYLLCG
jgi:amino acid adenylation domain-containing protein